MKESAAAPAAMKHDGAPGADAASAAAAPEAAVTPRAIVRVVSVVASWRRQEGVSWV